MATGRAYRAVALDRSLVTLLATTGDLAVLFYRRWIDGTYID
jgi:hypothetical protein